VWDCDIDLLGGIEYGIKELIEWVDEHLLNQAINDIE